MKEKEQLEENINYNKKYYENNKDKILERNKIWRNNNKEYLKDYQKKYYENNKDKIYQQQREYAKEHRDKLAQSSYNSRRKRAELLRNQGIINPFAVINGREPKYKK